MDIQFGEVKEAEPNRELRPDQDAQYAVVTVGDLAPVAGDSSVHEPSASSPSHESFHIDGDGDAFNNEPGDRGFSDVPEDELKIFVDLDVMRAMELHAASNTSVELGGVMLGYQRIDDEGKPFVVVTECLQAEHYEAAKTSFKFTHDTWSKITDDRALFHPDLEMVGWYHTHPGFGIFLSGMDLFICNNFFSRDLDVALVIDPKRRERGWFQWVDDGRQRRTRETHGFYLITNRFRKDELQFYAQILSGGQAMNFDPRLTNYSSGGQPVINITENRRSVFEMGMLAMLTMQFLFVGLVAWKMLVPGEANSGSLDSSVRQQVYGEVIDSIVNQKTGEEGVLEKLTTANLENTRLSANLDGQILRGNTLEKRLQDSLRTVEMLKREKSDLEVKNGQLADNNNSLKVQLKELGVEPKTEALDLEWVWWSLGSIALVVAGGAVGFLVGQRKPHEGEAVTSYESIAEESETPGERLRLDDRDSASD